MPSVEIRKQVTLVEDIFHEGGPVARSPYRRAAIIAVIKNPFAGRYVEEIIGFSDDLKPLGLDMANALIANAVDLPGHPAIRRTPARDLDPQSDLGERRVTVAVGPLTPGETEHALASGAAEAELWRELGLIEAAALRLGERTRLVGAPASRHLGRIPAVARDEEKARHAVG